MKRTRSYDCDQWLASDKRKPLVVRGARQVGKTWLVRDLAQRHKRELVELNLERRPEFAQLFLENNPQRTCRAIEAATGISLDPARSILFIDEIQAAPEVIPKLRWFYEDLPDLPVVAAGSLLEFALQEHSFSVPVGRISYLHLEPLSFTEWGRACGREELVEYLDTVAFEMPLPEALHQDCLRLAKDYALTGGLPEVAAAWVATQDLRQCMRLQHDLLATYREDFHKYAGSLSPALLSQTLSSAARQLGGKFVYRSVDDALRTERIKKALDLLCTARVCHRVTYSAANGVPLAAETNEKRFKIILLDIGMAAALLELGQLSEAQRQQIELSNKGALMEQWVGQQLRTLGESFRQPALYYWQREKGRPGEIDYVIQGGAAVVPLEVKAGAAGRMKSLHQFMVDKGLSLAVRVSSQLPSDQVLHVRTTQGQPVVYRLLTVPYYMLEQLPRLLQQAAGGDTC